MQTSSDLSYVSIIPNVPGPYAVLYASESSFVYENIFSEGYVSQTTFDWILGGSWYLYTRDGGKTISGGMKLMGAPAYTGLTFGIIQYVATFTGSLIGQIGQ